MPRFTGRFEYLVPGQGVVQAGPGELSFDDQALTLVSGGPAISFDLGDIDVFAPGDYELRLTLYTGNQLRLTHFAKAFQDLARQLLEAHRDRLVRCLLVSDLDEVTRFAAHVHLDSPGRACSGPAEVRLYESNIAVLPDAALGFQWRLAEIDAVEFDERDYAVVLTRGGERLAVGRLAKRTGELADRVRSRIAALDERSARTLRALCPFLAPDQFRRAASLMREGTSAPVVALRPIHPLIERVLLDRVVDGGLRPYLRALAGRATTDGWYAGFKIVRTEAAGEGAAAPAPGDAEVDGAPGPEEEAEDGAEPADAVAPAITDLGDGLEVLYWFFFPIAAPGGTRAARLAWEATSSGGRATYLFRLDPGAPLDEAVATINRGLVALNFRREPVYLTDDTLESDVRYRHYAIAQRKVPELRRVREAFAGRAIHTTVAGWGRQLDRRLLAP